MNNSVIVRNRIGFTQTGMIRRVTVKCPTFLTHWSRVTHICISKVGHNWFRQWLVACSVPSHYLNQCWNIINLTLKIKIQLNVKWNSYIIIQENAFENVICKMAAILSRPRRVKWRQEKLPPGGHAPFLTWLMASSRVSITSWWWANNRNLWSESIKSNT